MLTTVGTPSKRVSSYAGCMNLFPFRTVLCSVSFFVLWAITKPRSASSSM